MAIFKKINRATGEVALRYIVFDGDVDKLKKEIHYFDMYRSPDGEYFDDLYDFGYWAAAKEYGFLNEYYCRTRYLVKIHHRDKHPTPVVEFTVVEGMAIMPYRNRHEAHSGYSPSDIDFSTTARCSPSDLEALYPIDKYDTVEEVKNGNIQENQ